MISPAAMFIEIGADSIRNVPSFIALSQLKELHAFGEEKAKVIGASGLTDDFMKGYELGLATARAVIARSPAAMLGGQPQNIL
jgi:hypothetical protein